MSEKHAFVIMIKDGFWRSFCDLNRNGKKRFSYVQRGGWAPPKNASQIFFYVTKPVSQMAGYADFIERKVGDANSVWSEHGDESVLKSKRQYEEFVRDNQNVAFVRFKNLHEASNPVPFASVCVLLRKDRLSRRGFYIDKETADKLVTLMG
jgi:predicted transcriptional regulator